MDVTANCICDIHCIAIDGFDLNTVHKLSSQEKKSQLRRDSNPGLLDGNQQLLELRKHKNGKNDVRMKLSVLAEELWVQLLVGRQFVCFFKTAVLVDLAIFDTYQEYFL